MYSPRDLSNLREKADLAEVDKHLGQTFPCKSNGKSRVKHPLVFIFESE